MGEDNTRGSAGCESVGAYTRVGIYSVRGGRNIPSPWDARVKAGDIRGIYWYWGIY